MIGWLRFGCFRRWRTVLSVQISWGWSPSSWPVIVLFCFVFFCRFLFFYLCFFPDTPFFVPLLLDPIFSSVWSFFSFIRLFPTVCSPFCSMMVHLICRGMWNEVCRALFESFVCGEGWQGWNLFTESCLGFKWRKLMGKWFAEFRLKWSGEGGEGERKLIFFFCFWFFSPFLFDSYFLI